MQAILDDDQVEVSVTDDGNGPPETPVHGLGLGLGSMAARARELHGSFLFAPGPISGTVVRWCAPLPRDGG